MNSKDSLRRKSYSSKSLITEYRTNFLNSIYDKYKNIEFIQLRSDYEVMRNLQGFPMITNQLNFLSAR